MARSTPRTTRFVSNAENTPPTNPSSLAKTRAANARRRVRPSSKADTAAAAEAATRPRKNLVRITATASASPSPVPAEDVEMGGVDSPIAAAGMVRLPRSSSRQNSPAPSSDEPPAEYVKDALELFRKSLMYTAAHTRTADGDAPVYKESLPSSIDLRISVPNAVHMPSHTLAVYTATPSSTPSTSSFPPKRFADPTQLENQPHTRVQLYPVHAPVLTTMCTALPPDALPETTVADAHSTQLTTPLVALGVAHADAFKHVFAYLYHHSPAHLLAALLPTTPTLNPAVLTADPSTAAELRRAHAASLTGYSTDDLLGFARTISNVWRNVQQLGIEDEGLWQAMDVAWDVLFRALVLRGYVKVNAQLDVASA